MELSLFFPSLFLARPLTLGVFSCNHLHTKGSPYSNPFSEAFSQFIHRTEEANLTLVKFKY
jgi:hypothetical protein